MDELPSHPADNENSLHFVLASMGLSSAPPLQESHAASEEFVQEAERPASPPCIRKESLDARQSLMASMHPAFIFAATLLLPILLKLILSFAETSNTSMDPACRNASAPAFVNLTAIAQNFSLLHHPIPREAMDASFFPVQLLGNFLSPRKEEKQPVLHVTYMADAYHHQPGGMCSIYCCSSSVPSSHALFLPQWLLALLDATKQAKFSIVSGCLQEGSGMAAFLRTMQDRIPEDWHLQGFQQAMASSCAATAESRKLLLQRHASVVEKVDDALVPSRLCSMMVGEEQGPLPPATIGRCLR